MKSFFSFLAVVLMVTNVLWAQTSSPKPVVLGVISNVSKAEYDTTIVPFITKTLSGCKACEVKNLSTYTEQGDYQEKQLAKQIESAIDQVTVLFVGWNQVNSEELKPVLEAIQKALDKNIFVLAAAGFPKKDDSGASLSKTVLGQISDVVIVGELTDREKLLQRSYFGPEMLTAVRLPKELRDQEGLGPLYFAGKLVSSWGNKSTNDWWTSLRNKKAQSKKLWPQVEDFFGYK